MANILDRYGIKEVADVTFYELSDAGVPTKPVLFLDTLKVSTIEQTAESTDAKGGKGNTALISWDYGKEINVTLEDALFSAKSMAIMFGNGTVKGYTGNNALIMKTESFQASANGDIPVQGTSSLGWSSNYEGPDGKLYLKLNPKFYNADGTTPASLTKDETYFCTFDIAVDGSVIEVSASSFPGTYYVTGDTFARAEKNGKDEFFQFIIPKAKVQSQNTITLQAEGDPSTFNMSLKVLRPSDGVMMRLVKYNAANAQDAAAESSTADLIHNHVLTPVSIQVDNYNPEVEVDDTTTGIAVTVLNDTGCTVATETGAKITATKQDAVITIKATASAEAGKSYNVTLTPSSNAYKAIVLKVNVIAAQ